ncbi:pyridoxamine 5'-phosphate oxidase [[Mycobacterium] nativiensis]|uniref:Pyridoxamine 5'-phosphate oxidase n=1 Tax=[Mycobacterium] nativiensis TaxID=2855503 RepID=A0ABU5Y3A4_9MYCO|nr:pyridoxamine 5'-phosphate oxidase [Mycolicibacter sp. MYC340]MEB3034697.1 pyridoxamine 5'-phosphate oxidase [Mycolicibacter sp. MYC340]
MHRTGPDNEHLAAMRVEYQEKDNSGDLEADWLDEGWEVLLRNWIGDAERAGVAEPNAMVVATVEAGRPVTRSVLCKNLDAGGVTFFTDAGSAKAAELAQTPFASATFPWYQLGRQVHIRGRVSRTDAAVPAEYWAHRPRASQLGFWASQQSQPIASRAALLDQLAAVTDQFADLKQIPVPSNWVGYVIAPEVVEFWQGREGRLHNRIRVTGGRIERLQP